MGMVVEDIDVGAQTVKGSFATLVLFFGMRDGTRLITRWGVQHIGRLRQALVEYSEYLLAGDPTIEERATIVHLAYQQANKCMLTQEILDAVTMKDGASLITARANLHRLALDIKIFETLHTIEVPGPQALIMFGFINAVLEQFHITGKIETSAGRTIN